MHFATCLVHMASINSVWIEGFYLPCVDMWVGLYVCVCVCGVCVYGLSICVMYTDTHNNIITSIIYSLVSSTNINHISQERNIISCNVFDIIWSGYELKHVSVSNLLLSRGRVLLSLVSSMHVGCKLCIAYDLYLVITYKLCRNNLWFNISH